MRHILSLSALLGLSFAAAIAQPARADTILPIADVRPLVEWVESRTNLMLLPRPHIFISSQALLKLTSAGSGQGHEKIAAYRDGVIFISQRYWQPDDIADQSVLVHELVHYAQDLGDRTYACAGQREEEAYRLQNLYLMEHGERPFLDSADLKHLKSCE